MEIKFEPVRLGKFRENHKQEILIKENYYQLKNSLREFVKTIEGKNVNDIIFVDIVIPSKGNRISITLDAIKDDNLKKMLIENFPNSIYKGDYSKLLDAMGQQIFPTQLGSL